MRDKTGTGDCHHSDATQPEKTIDRLLWSVFFSGETSFRASSIEFEAMTNASKRNARILLLQAPCSMDATEAPAVWSMSLEVEMVVSEEPCREWWANREQWPSHVLATRVGKRAIQRMVSSKGKRGKRASVWSNQTRQKVQTIFSNNSVILNK